MFKVFKIYESKCKLYNTMGIGYEVKYQFQESRCIVVGYGVGRSILLIFLNIKNNLSELFPDYNIINFILVYLENDYRFYL